MRKATRSQRGFTLIELVIVVTVIAILAVLLVPTIVDVMDRSRDRTARGTLVNIQKAFARYQQDTGRWPSPLGNWNWSGFDGEDFGEFDDEFTSLRILPSDDSSLARCQPGQVGVRCWNGPYVLQNFEEVRDPWGNRYRYYYRPPSQQWAVVEGNFPTCVGCDGLAPNIPTGSIVIYSLGKDGKDGAACVPPNEMDGCSLAPEKIGAGLPSADGADDIIVVVSNTAL